MRQRLLAASFVQLGDVLSGHLGARRHRNGQHLPPPAVETGPIDADRLRIALSVNDTVIRHLFSIGLDLQTTRAQASETVQHRLDESIDQLDEAIQELRLLIFDLERTADDGRR